ncbi:MAG: M67 family metallopeptidase, partial [Acidimicrobiia bacterium]|nr:M67 family metallopeptidase [Acidimicrobiia bacterium]
MEVNPQIVTAMVAHARFAYPEECCGLLAVDPGGTVRMAYCLTNTRHSTRRFSVDPTEHYRALKHAESLGWELGGVFHSHPRSPAYPSPVDIAADL